MKKEQKKQFPYQPYQVPWHIHRKLEEEARAIRKRTGENISWSGVLREIIEDHFIAKGAKNANVDDKPKNDVQ